MKYIVALVGFFCLSKLTSIKHQSEMFFCCCCCCRCLFFFHKKVGLDFLILQDVHPNSPADIAGLRPHTDYIIGSDTVLHDVR